MATATMLVDSTTPAMVACQVCGQSVRVSGIEDKDYDLTKVRLLKVMTILRVWKGGVRVNTISQNF